MKYIDTTTGATSVGDGCILTLLNGCQRGDDYNHRTGRRVVGVSLSVRCTLQPDTTCLGSMLRAAVVVDHQPNGTAMTSTQLWSAGTSTYVTAEYNRDYFGRFSVLKDVNVSIPALGAAGQGGQGMKTLNWLFRLRLPVLYNSGDAGTIADISTNSVYLILVAANAATAGAKYTLHTRFGFIDA